MVMVDYHIVPAHTFICLDYHIEAVNHLYTTGSNCNVPSPGMCPSSSPSSTKGPELAIRRSWRRDWWAFSPIFVFFFNQRISSIFVFFRENPRPWFGIFFDNMHLGAVHILRQPKTRVPTPPLPPPSAMVSIWLTPPPPSVSNGKHLA